MFVGRQKELALLNRVYRQRGFQIAIMYGKSGAGKTTLLEEFCRGKNAIFFSAKKETSRSGLMKFSDTVLKHYKDEEHEPFAFWDNALMYIIQQDSGEERLLLVLEDFADIAERDTVFLSMLQNMIDKHLKNTEIIIIISTYDIRFLQRTFLNKNSQLSRWVTGQIYVEPFSLNTETVEQIKKKAVNASVAWTGARVKKFAAESIILREGEKNSEMYKILSGKAVCYLNYGTDDEYVLGTLRDNNSFGEFSLLTGRPGIYTVVAFTDMLVLRIPEQDFRKFLELNAHNAMEIMTNMAGMLNVMKVNIDMLNKEIRS